MIKLATWNVNSLKVRLPQVLAWLDTTQTDVLALQETKTTNEALPLESFTEQGFHVAYSGQKTYNGVAVVSRYPLNDVLTDIPGLVDPQRRILAVSIGDVRLVNLYVPNGAAVDTDKYAYKLDWLEKVQHFLAEELRHYSKLAVVGDFNIAPEDRDVHDPAAWEGSVLVSPRERQAFASFLKTGLVDAFRYQHPDDRQFSWWDYRAGAFRQNHGLRIDHVLLSTELAKQCQEAVIDKGARKNERPSDHAPVMVEMTIDLP